MKYLEKLKEKLYFKLVIFGEIKTLIMDQLAKAKQPSCPSFIRGLGCNFFFFFNSLNR